MLVSTHVGEEGLDVGEVDLIINFDVAVSCARVDVVSMTSQCASRYRRLAQHSAWVVLDERDMDASLYCVRVAERSRSGEEAKIRGKPHRRCICD